MYRTYVLLYFYKVYTCFSYLPTYHILNNPKTKACFKINTQGSLSFDLQFLG